MVAGRAAWADYDGDGDPDLALVGEAANDSQCFPIARVFRNDSGILVEDDVQTQQLAGTFYGDVAWADYDNDGDLDLLIAGRDAMDGESLRLYANRVDGGTDRRLELVSTPNFVGVRYAAAAWGDMDRDGDLDLIVAGMDAQGHSRTLLYRYTESVDPDSAFEADEINNQNLIAVHNGDVAWGDYDNDGDLDLTLAGENIASGRGIGLVTEFYRNEPLGSLSVDEETSVETRVKGGSLAWSDYDSDGDLDLAVSGRDEAWNASTTLYLNQPTGLLARDARFVPAIQGGMAARLAWIDYDGDGDPDLAAAGSSVLSTYHTTVFDNREGTLAGSASVELPGLAGDDVAWADYDNDGRIELLVLGEDETGQPHTRLYRDLGPANQAPVPPAQLLSAQAIGGGIRFNWLPGGDAESRTLTYNLRIGSEPGAGDILSGAVPWGPGNAGTGTSFFLRRDLPPDITYYWSVQTVDGSLARSPWSREEQLDVQQVVSSQQRLVGLMESAMDWGDYDSDGDPDLVIMGENRSSQAQTSLYENRGGTLVERTDAGLVDLRWGDVAWADYDSDGDLDLAHSGLDSGEQGFGFLYRNDAGRLTIHRELAEVLKLTGPINSAGAYSDLDWGDYDNDGDLDLYVVNREQGNSLYRNEGAGSAFAEVACALSVDNRKIGQAAAWADFDGDGDLDLALIGEGDDGGQCRPIARIFRNDNGSLVEDDVQTQPLVGAFYGDVNWADYDGDGDLDLLIAGRDAMDGESLRLYANEAAGGTDRRLDLVSTPYFVGVRYAAAAWGDVDRDGDNDGRMELLVFGVDETGRRHTRLYRDLNSAPANTPPAPPVRLRPAQVAGSGVRFSWLPGVDAESRALTYNLRIGTEPGTDDILSGTVPFGPGAAQSGAGRPHRFRHPPARSPQRRSPVGRLRQRRRSGPGACGQRLSGPGA